MRYLFPFLLTVLLAAPFTARAYDIVVYGGNAAGVMTAVQADRLGKSVLLLEPGEHLGGLTASGLGATDIGQKFAIGGLAREFYQRVHAYYQQPGAWREETRSAYLPRHEDAVAEPLGLQFFFEPSVAARILAGFLAETKVEVRLRARLDRSPSGLGKDGTQIRWVRLEDGTRVEGRIFIDCTYEGDLLAAAGVSHTIGRESREVYGESLAGIRYYDPERTRAIDPFVVPGNPASGTLPGVLPQAPGPEGAGDHRVQAYNFRVCLTDAPENRIPFAKPADYDPVLYELLARSLAAKPRQTIGSSLFKLTPMPNRKTDSNNQGNFSTDFVGFSYDWAGASYTGREAIFARHRSFVRGFFWFLANDPRVPAAIRRDVARWGWPKDEFTDSENFPWQLYVREARRMISDYVVTEQDCTGKREAGDTIGLASYPMDSHQVSRFIDDRGHLRLEGAFWKSIPPYAIAYRAITPRAAECTNLLVPVCLSASHAAYGSIRMEPVFMILGQSAATAAALALDSGRTVQAIDYNDLRGRLLAGGQVLSLAQARAASAAAAKNAPSHPAPPPPVAVPPSPSVATLEAAGLLDDASGWTMALSGSQPVSAAQLNPVLIDAARRISKSTTLSDIGEALTALRQARIFDKDDYWRSRLTAGLPCKAGHVALLFEKLAAHPAIATP